MIAQIDREYCRTGWNNVLVRMASYSAFEGRPLTTRGQWVNAAIAPLLRQLARRHYATVTKPAFIVGLGRSGTTVLGQIMSVHPEIAWLNEPKLIWHLAYADEDIIGSYDTSENGYLRLKTEDASPGFVSRINSIMDGYLKVVHRPQLLDKYPELIYRLDFVRAAFPNPRFIALQRRAAECISSISLWSEVHRDHQSDWWGLRGKKWRVIHRELVEHDPDLSGFVSSDPDANTALAMALVEWLCAAEETVAHLADPDVLLVRYDGLVANPVDSVRNICEHIGVNSNPQLESFAKTKLRAGRKEFRLPEGFPASLVRRVAEAESALGLAE